MQSIFYGNERTWKIQAPALSAFSAYAASHLNTHADWGQGNIDGGCKTEQSRDGTEVDVGRGGSLEIGEDLSIQSDREVDEACKREGGNGDLDTKYCITRLKRLEPRTWAM